MKNVFTAFFFLVLCIFSACKSLEEWTNYGGNKANNHYSNLALIDTNNVLSLKKVWEYHTKDGDEKSQIQTNPLVIDGVLYGNGVDRFQGVQRRVWAAFEMKK